MPGVLRVLTTLLIAASVRAEVLITPADFDLYGGYRGIKSKVHPGGAEHFSVEKIDGQWWFVTPEGNAFFKLGVACVTLHGPAKDYRGKTYRDNVMAKYGKTEVWAQETTRRLRSWGFNTFDQYSGYVEPWSPYMKEKLAYIGTRGFARHAMHSKTINNLLQDLNCIHNGGGPRQFPDVFDPAFESFSQKHAEAFGDSRVDRKWILGITMDEADDLFGFGAAGGHPHLGWAAAQVNPRGKASEKVHSKYALADFLKKKYGNIAALNAAWTTTYTSFDSDGGWGKGSGLLDEDGRNLGDQEAYARTKGNWGKDFFANKQFKTKQLEQDLDEFLEQISRRYFSVICKAMRDVLPGVPLIAARGGPGSRAPIIRGAKDYIDVFYGTGAQEQVEAFYALAAKPVVGSFYGSANKDSAVAGREKNITSKYSSQQEKGQGYRDTLSKLALMRSGPQAEGPYIGCMVWCLFDAGFNNWETGNMGLVTVMDNAYDGVEARVTTGKDAAGRPIGGEERDYGDFITAARQANLSVYALRVPLQKPQPAKVPVAAQPQNKAKPPVIAAPKTNHNHYPAPDPAKAAGLRKELLDLLQPTVRENGKNKRVKILAYGKVIEATLVAVTGEQLRFNADGLELNKKWDELCFEDILGLHAACPDRSGRRVLVAGYCLASGKTDEYERELRDASREDDKLAAAIAALLPQ